MTVRRLLCRIWRVLRWLVLALVLLALCFVAAVWWANRNDDPLLPEVTKAMRFEPPSTEAMRGNGYFTRLGLGAPPFEDAFDAGQRFFAGQLQDHELYQRTGQSGSFADRASPHQLIDMSSSLRCWAEVDDCYARYLQHGQAIRSKLSEQATLIERYLSLREKPSYEEVIPPSIGIEFARSYDVGVASELIGMRVALLLNERRLDDALSLLETNTQIHRRLMEGSRTLIGAMTALALDVRQQRLVSSALRHVPALSVSHAQRLDALLQSMPVPLTGALEGETKFSLNALTPERLEQWQQKNPEAKFGERLRAWINQLELRLTYLPNTTVNGVYLNYQEAIRFAGLPADQLTAQAGTAKQKFCVASNGSWLLPFGLRNMTGNALLAIAIPDFQIPYIERAHDVEGYHRLIRLQIAALREHVPFDQMLAWLAKQPPELRNPYTLQPMGWDVATQSFVFEGRRAQPGTGSENVYRVRLTQTTP